MLAGGVAVFTLPIAQYPDVTPPTVLVTAFYPGRQLHHRARHGGRADRGTSQRRRRHDVHVVALHQRRHLHADRDFQAGHGLGHGPGAGAEPRLAGPAGDPALVQNEGITVKKMSPNTLMIVNLYLDGRPLRRLVSEQLRDIDVRDELGRLPGVAGVAYLGQRDYSLRAWLDPDKLAALDLSAMDVVTAISQQNMQVAAGQIGQQPGPQGPAISVDDQHPGPARRSGPVRRRSFSRALPTVCRAAAQWSDASSGGSAVDRLRQHRCLGRCGCKHRLAPRPIARPQPASSGSGDVAPGRTRAHSNTTSRARWTASPRWRCPSIQLPGLQRARHRQGRLRQDEGVEDPLSRRAGVPDRLRHHAFHPRIGQRSLLHACATR